MSSEYDRPGEESETACAHTSYDQGGGSGYAEKETADGPVPETGEGATGLERRVWDALYLVEDPEMPVSIVDLGLIYGVDVDPETGHATVEMTLTYTGCPAREMLLDDVETAVAAVEGIDTAEVTLVWSPGWTVDMVTDQGRESLREFGVSL